MGWLDAYEKSCFYCCHKIRAKELGRNGERKKGMRNVGLVRVRNKSTRGGKWGRWGIGVGMRRRNGKENGHDMGI